jgi:hypothetical protein
VRSVCSWRGWRSVAKLGSDHVENPFGVFENMAVLESDDENACGFEERPPLKIIELTRCREMSLAIKFDGQLFRWAVEIEDVLPTECCRTNLRRSNGEPFTSFQNAASAGVRVFRSAERSPLTFGSEWMSLSRLGRLISRQGNSMSSPPYQGGVDVEASGSGFDRRGGFYVAPRLVQPLDQAHRSCKNHPGLWTTPPA